MKFLFDFFPLLLFFAAYKYYDIFIATAVAIVASSVQVGWVWFKSRRVETIHVVTLAVIVIFGGLTLALRDEVFIKWKPTIVNWLFAVMMLATQFFGKKTAIERVLGGQIGLPARVWRHMNFSWSVFFFVLGVLNIYVAFYYGLDLDAQTRTDHWVNFKVFGLMGLTLAFTVVQMIFVARHIEVDEGKENP